MREFTTDVVIGLEIHVELDTASKLFCACPTKGSEEPNTRVCPVCLGHPGTRPVLNKRVLTDAIKLCIATGCKLAPELIFSRKSYFYPDMSKNFQTTQFEEPIGGQGTLRLRTGKLVGITRIHIEEDPASVSYPGTMTDSPYSFIDYNRSGNPLVEIVTEPELETPAEARDFLNALIRILSYIGIFDPDACIIKADANISLRESGYSRVEIKNISGFKELERALTYEITRQRALLRRNIKIKRETRGWNAVSKATYSLRSKESEDDYGYIIEPDLPIIDIDEQLVQLLSREIPELAHQRAARYVQEHALDSTDAEVLASELELAQLFERVAREIDPKLAARWLRRELLRVLNYAGKELEEIALDDRQLIELLSLVETSKISDATAQRLMERLMEGPFSPKEYVEQNGLYVVKEDGALREACRKVLGEQQKALADYRAGEEKSFHFLLGQVMRLTRGKADPQLTKQILEEETRLHK